MMLPKPVQMITPPCDNTGDMFPPPVIFLGLWKPPTTRLPDLVTSVRELGSLDYMFEPPLVLLGLWKPPTTLFSDMVPESRPSYQPTLLLLRPGQIGTVIFFALA